MDEMEWIKLLGIVPGVLIGLSTPYLSDCYLESRARRENRFMERTKRALWEKGIYILAGAAACGLSMWMMPIGIAVLVWVMTLLLLIVADIDNRCRLIPNPFVLSLLVLGIGYRLVDEGLKGLAGMGMALLVAIIVLVLAGVLTRLIMRASSPVGAGDVKLILVMAITSGMPSFLYGMGAMALCMFGYTALGVMTRMMTLRSYIPLGGSIVAGYLVSLFC